MFDLKKQSYLKTAVWCEKLNKPKQKKYVKW